MLTTKMEPTLRVWEIHGDGTLLHTSEAIFFNQRRFLLFCVFGSFLCHAIEKGSVWVALVFRGARGTSLLTHVKVSHFLLHE